MTPTSGKNIFDLVALKIRLHQSEKHKSETTTALVYGGVYA
jgi:hypothetical protein